MSPIAINILLSFDEDNHVWLAHCLEMDLFGTGDTPKAAVKELLEVLQSHLEDATPNQSDFLFPAPKEYWVQYQQATPVDLHELFADEHQLPPHVIVRSLAQDRHVS